MVIVTGVYNTNGLFLKAMSIFYSKFFFIMKKVCSKQKYTCLFTLRIYYTSTSHMANVLYK